jgi:hypothetical protein
MRAELQAWRTLDRAERGSLASAWTWLLFTDLALFVLPVPRVAALLRLVPGKRSHGLPPARLAELVESAGRHHYRKMTCLTRSLALQALLRRQGLEADLRIGVRRVAGQLRAHAWVEHAGMPVGEREGVDRTFLPLAAGGSVS